MTVRIISGEFRTRRLHTPPDNDSARPLPDRVRTSLFNMLKGHLEGNEAFDAFAGVGSFGLEGISRGLKRCIMVERDKRVLQLLRRNCEEVGAGDRAEIVPADALGPAALARCPQGVHIVFFDPPYPMMLDAGQRARVMDQLARCIAKLDEDGFAILRTPWPYTQRPDPAPGESHDVRDDGSEEEDFDDENTASRDLLDLFDDDDEHGGDADDGGEEGADAFDAYTRHHPADREDHREYADELPAGSGAGAMTPRAPQPRPTRIPLDVPGAKGPETHIYGSMALHWYMRS